MITAYTHKNLKNTADVDLNLQTVTLILGANRSSKSAVLDGLALAATGRCSVGGARAQSVLLSKGHDAAFSRLFFGDQLTGGWYIQKKGSSYSAKHAINDAGGDDLKPEELFGDFLYIDDFWRLTGEEKWRAIGRLLSAAIPEEDRALLTQLATEAKVKLSDDAIADLVAITDNLAARTKQLKAQRDEVKNSLTPPDQYTGRPLAQLQPRKTELDQFVTNQRQARMLQMQTQRLTASRAEELASLNKSLESYQSHLSYTQKEVEELEGLLSSIAPHAESLRAEFKDDTPITVACRSKTIREVLADTMSQTARAINDCMVTLKRYATDFTLQGEVNTCAENLNTLVFMLQTCGDSCIDVEIPPPAAVAEIQRLLEYAKVALPESLAGYAYTDGLVREHLQCVRSKVHKIEESIASVQRSIERVQSEQAAADAKLPAICTDEELEAAVAEVRQLNEEIAKANKWAEFIDNQKRAVRMIDQIDADIAASEALEGKARKLRGELLARSIEPIELNANEFLRTMYIGLMPLQIKLTSTAKRSSLSIETITGVDFSAMSGAEKIFYGTALVSAIQQLSPAKSPLLLIEAAEVDADGMTALLAALSVRIIKGNVVIAHWCAPTCTPPSVEVIDRQLETAGA